MTYPAYDFYKESNTMWMGNIPAHWGATPLFGLLKERGELNTGEVTDNILSVLKDVGVINYRDKGDIGNKKSEDIERYKLVKVGDIVINSMNVIIGSAGVAREDGALSPVYIVLVPRKSTVDTRYYGYVFQSRLLQQSLKRIGYGILEHRMRIPMINLKRERLPEPPLVEQLNIACFLDNETAQIDTLIAKQQQLIELLQEKRQALISHAVTKGLNPDAPMKDSGYDLLKRVPAHWRVARLKFLAYVRSGVAKGRSLDGKDTLEVPYLRVANVQDGYLDLSDVATIEIGEDELERYSLMPGDVLMNEGGDNDKLGRGDIWHGEIEPCIHQNHVFAVRPHAIDSEWLNLVTSAEFAKAYFQSKAKQSTNLASISSSNLRELPVPIPSLSERQTILESVRKEQQTLDRLIEKCIHAIQILQERRTALISAAVTGKIDVRSRVN